MGRRVAEPKQQQKQTMIDTLKRAFELNQFDYMAADALALTYNVSGSENAELTTLWEGRRDKAMSDISINMKCATKNNRLLSYACEWSRSLFGTACVSTSLLFQSSNPPCCAAAVGALNPQTGRPYVSGVGPWHPDVV